MSDATTRALPGRPCWSDRMFAATRVEPAWLGVGALVCLLAVTLLGAQLTGRLAVLIDLGPAALFTERDPRSIVLFIVLFVYAITARRYVLLGAGRSFDALAPVLARQPSLDVAALRAELIDRPTDPARRLRLAGASLLIAPLVAYGIDQDLGIYVLPEYWNFERFAQWVFGLALCWNIGLLLDATLACSRRFDALAACLERIDLLRLGELAPFANLGLRIALVWLLMAAVFALNLVDGGYVSSVVLLSVLTIAMATAGVLPPVLGARRRVRDAKRDELDRIARALEGDAGALAGSSLERRAGSMGVADLLAYRSYVAGLSEWPFDAPMLLRLLLYGAIPLGSWVGGAFVERLLESTLS